MSKHQRLGQLLSAAQFSTTFIQNVDKTWRKARGYMLTIDDPNVLSLVTKDFFTNSQLKQSVLSTNVPLAYLAAEAEEDIVMEDLLLKDLRTRMIGPGFHIHSLLPTMALCCESLEAEGSSSVQLGLSKYVNRFALISIASLDQLLGYISDLEKKSSSTDVIRRFICRDGNSWSRDTIPIRKSNTLFLGPLWQDILTDVQDFLSDETRKFYTDHGIPYVRTYLFYGSPGNGKTSCIKTLASELKLNLYSLNMASANLDDNGLVDMVHSMMKRSIMAIEDVDRIFNNFTQNETKSAVSFSTMINLLDGILSKDGSIFVLTCNNKEQLDEALRRCGRIHREFEFKDATAKISEDMFLSFYPGAMEESKKFAKKIKEKQHVPMAAIQEFFLKHRKRTATEVTSESIDDSMFVSRRKLETMSG